MSSATSINKVLPPKGGSHGGSHDKSSKKGSGSFRLQAEEASVDPGFHVWHFFVLLSLIAATVAVTMAQRTTPEHLILISLTIGAAGAAAYAFYKTIVPLAFRDAAQTAEPIGDRLRADLEREKTLVLRSIKELEFDRAMGKLSAQNFDEMAGRLRSRAIGIMKQLDGGGYRAIIERDLAARMGRSTSTSPQQADSGTPDLKVGPTGGSDSIVGSGSSARHTGVCVCGVQNDQDARFCKACGTRLEAA